MFLITNFHGQNFVDCLIFKTLAFIYDINHMTVVIEHSDGEDCGYYEVSYQISSIWKAGILCNVVLYIQLYYFGFWNFTYLKRSLEVKKGEIGKGQKPYVDWDGLRVRYKVVNNYLYKS